MNTKNPTVSDYMTRSPHSIGFDQTLVQAHKLMREHEIRHLPVLRGGKLIGILSERDLAFVEALRDVDSAKLRVEEAMTPLPFTAAPSTPLAGVAREMAEHRYGAAVVMQEGHVVGVFTTTDALRALADALDDKG
ncbi:CBS domain-containing protein [Polyangium mundeleinium]|uniref:CBS domain-containing protein n=1 Tax=Polyangium mundeleinium TaxID=2995306 RepID=A0ABT5EFD2_9BACT|nr:CBS domain-containing protein [Polyangium mundeleinium]MDC0740539.1 CBS domain-containing protein [Polyangium mundeleinium]